MTSTVLSASALSSRRYFGILTGASSGLLARGLAVAMSLLAVNAVLPYLGPAKFGAWAVITTFQLWLQLADFGIPAGMNNRLAVAIAEGDARDARRVVFTSTVLVACAAALVFIVCAAALSFGWTERVVELGSPAEMRDFERALLAGIGITLAGLPNAVVTRALAIQHRAYVANFWMSIGQAGAIAGLLLGARWHLDLRQLTLLTTGAVTSSALCCVAFFFWSQPRYRPVTGDFVLRAIRSFASASLSYSSLQLAGMLLLNSAIFIVSAALSPVSAAVFAATSRLTSICTLVTQLASPYFWAAYSDALIRHDHRWLRQAFFRHLAASLGTTLLLGILLVAWGPAAIRWWSSDAIVPDLALLYWLVAWQLVIATMNPIGALLVAHERYWLQTVTSMGAGILGAAAGYAIAPQLGPAGVVAAATISYLLVVVVPIARETRALLTLR